MTDRGKSFDESAADGACGTGPKEEAAGAAEWSPLATEALLRSVMESSADYILSIKPEDGEILYLNRSTITGKTASDYFGTSLFDLLRGPSQRALRACMDRVVTTRGNGSCEISFDHPEKGMRHYDVSISPVIQDGRIQSLTLNSRDITARKAAEQALRDREQKLRILVEQLPAILWTTDADLVVKTARGAGFRAIEATPDVMVGRTVAELVHLGVYQDGGEQRHREALDGRSVDYVTSPDERTHQVHLEPLRDEKGACVGVAGLAFDVTRMRQTSAALNRALERLELVTASVSDGLWSVKWDPIAGYSEHYHSPVMTRITGRAFDFFRNRPKQWVSIVHQDDRQRVRDWLDALHESPQQDYRQELEYRILLPDDSQRWVRDSVSVKPTANGGMRLHGVVTDITARKEAERQALQHMEELAHAGRLSTMGEMVAGIAHEINQPLYAITNYAAACRNMLIDAQTMNQEKVLKWIEEIGVQAERVAYIISRLANFVRKSASKPELLTIDELLADSVNLLAFELRAQDVQLIQNLAAPAPHVRGNRIELQQVLVNLIRNACDAMAEALEGERYVRVRTETVGSRARIHISDNGHGFDDAQPNRIFDAFFTTKSHGMGLGLAISQSIVEAAGGRIWATPNRGRGATLHFELPIWSKSDADSKP